MSSAPPSNEGWRAFASTVGNVDPGATLTGAPDAGIAIRTLPRLSIAERGAPEGSDLVVTGVLGEGGMGRVLLTHQRSLRREVAIKRLKAEEPPPGAVDALLAEAVVTGSLEHPNIVPVHALGLDDRGRPALVMKRIEGVSWKTIAADPAHAAWAAIAPDGGDRLGAHLEILMAACNALHFAHSRGVVHRDVKLSNVMIGSFGEVYVVDWGVAVRTPVSHGDGAEPGALVGTPAYMPPEMARGDLARIDARTDVYLLGATLHAVLTGRPRHQGESIFDVLLSASESLPFDYGPEVSTELGALCNRAMNADPDERFPSALALRSAVASFRRHRGSIALSDEATERLDELRGLGVSANERRVHALMTECRFGFTQALRIWPENPAARAGREACLTLMIEHEIAQRDADGARALYGDLASARPDLLARIEALATELAATREREIRLRALERDRDLGIGSRAQLAFITLLPIIATGTNVYLFRHGEMRLSPRDLLSPSALLANAILFVAYFVFRRRMRTEISRKAFAVILLTALAWVVNHALALVLDCPLPMILAVDLLVASFMATSLAITLVRQVGWLVAPGVLSMLAILVWPDWSAPIFTVATTIGLVLLPFVWRSAVKS